MSKSTFLLLCLPVVVWEVLVPEQQVSEAEVEWQRRHLTLQLLHLQSRNVQDDSTAAAGGGGGGLEWSWERAGGRNGEQKSKRGRNQKKEEKLLGKSEGKIEEEKVVKEHGEAEGKHGMKHVKT